MSRNQIFLVTDSTIYATIHGVGYAGSPHVGAQQAALAVSGTVVQMDGSLTDLMQLGAGAHAP